MRNVLMRCRFLWALLPLLWAGIASAAEITLTCTLPTLNTDGSTITNLSGIRYYEAQVSGGPYTRIGETPGCSITINRPTGTWYFVATAYNTAGEESVYSNEAQKIVPPPIPSPPSGLTVTGSLLAYGLSQSKDALTVYPVGRVPLNTACDGSMTVQGMYRVPVDTVAWVGTARPVFVVAECG